MFDQHLLYFVIHKLGGLGKYFIGKPRGMQSHRTFLYKETYFFLIHLLMVSSETLYCFWRRVCHIFCGFRWLHFEKKITLSFLLSKIMNLFPLVRFFCYIFLISQIYKTEKWKHSSKVQLVWSESLIKSYGFIWLWIWSASLFFVGPKCLLIFPVTLLRFGNIYSCWQCQLVHIFLIQG